MSLIRQLLSEAIPIFHRGNELHLLGAANLLIYNKSIKDVVKSIPHDLGQLNPSTYIARATLGLFSSDYDIDLLDKGKIVEVVRTATTFFTVKKFEFHKSRGIENQMVTYNVTNHDDKNYIAKWENSRKIRDFDRLYTSEYISWPKDAKFNDKAPWSQPSLAVCLNFEASTDKNTITIYDWFHRQITSTTPDTVIQTPISLTPLARTPHMLLEFYTNDELVRYKIKSDSIKLEIV